MKCASEGVRSNEDYTVGTFRRSLTATCVYLIDAPIPGECVCVTEAGKRTTCCVSVICHESVSHEMDVVCSCEGSRKGGLRCLEGKGIVVVTDEFGM